MKWDDEQSHDDVEQRVILQKAWVNLAKGLRLVLSDPPARAISWFSGASRFVNR